MKEQEFWKIVLTRFQTQWDPWMRQATHFEAVDNERARNIVSENFPVPKILESINKDIDSWGADNKERAQRERFHRRLLLFFVDYFAEETADYMREKDLKKLDSGLVKQVKEQLVKSVPKMSGIYPC